MPPKGGCDASTTHLGIDRYTAAGFTAPHDPRPYVRERCAALLKIADGQSPHAVARHGLLKPRDPDTVYEWLNWYEQLGLRSVWFFQHGGKHRVGL
jgi:hypothetical protein